MEIRIYEKDLTLADVCDGATAVTATEAFAAAGSFSLTVPLAEAGKFARERIVRLPGIGDGYVIQSVKADASAGTAQVTGAGVLSLFDRCILTEDVIYEGTAEPLLLELAVRYGPTVLSAPLSTVEFGLTESVNTVLADRTLLSGIKSAAAAAGLGMRLSVRAGEYVFNLRPVTDGALLLSRGRGNLTGGTRLWDHSGYVNRVILQGGDGTRVIVRAAGLFDDGVDDAAQPLREILRYATDIKPQSYETEAEYIAALRAEGQRILSACRPVNQVHLSVPSETAALLRVGCAYDVEDETLGVHGRALCVKKTLRAARWQCDLRMQ